MTKERYNAIIKELIGADINVNTFTDDLYEEYAKKEAEDDRLLCIAEAREDLIEAFCKYIFEITGDELGKEEKDSLRKSFIEMEKLAKPTKEEEKEAEDQLKRLIKLLF